MNLSLDNRIFVPIENSESGVVDVRTEFHFSQTGTRFQANYAGGEIQSGNIIGHFTGEQSGQLLYHCETQDGVLKAGRADATFEEDEKGKLIMFLNWEWVFGANGAGQSKYVELSETTL